ncbi:MAG: hypothetical protein QXJ64_06830 [Thermosphaera sp.]
MISLVILGFIGIFAAPFREIWPVYILALPSLISAVILYILVDNRKKECRIKANITEVIGLALIILFRLFVYISALGTAMFPMWDIVYQAEYIARLNRYGISAYLSSPLTERYPIFYFLAYSLITRLLPFPYINTIIIITLFNHIYASLAFYYLSKKLLRNLKKSLFSIFVFTILSGFAWIYLLISPPNGPMSKSDLYNYITAIRDKFGMYSGATVSTIYADCHALVRLYGLGVAFSSIAALLSAYQNQDEWKKYILFFFFGFLQITIGHPTENLLLVFTLLILLLIAYNDKLFRNIFKGIILLSIFSLLFAFIFKYFKEILYSIIVIIVIYYLSFYFLRKIIYRLNSILIFTNNKKIFLKIIAIIFVYYYGLSFILFFSEYNNINIRYPIFTLWYSIPIQLGFQGLLFILTIIKYAIVGKKLEFSMKYSMLMILFLLLFIIIVNYINLYFVYIILPYPVIPIYFFPFLSLCSAHILPSDVSIRRSRKIAFAVVSLVILIFSAGSLTHILSVSYWNHVNWWGGGPGYKSLRYEEIEIINLIYASKPITKILEEACFISKDNPFLNIKEVIEYQTKIRYTNYLEWHLIKIAGLNTPSRMIESALYDAKSLDEVVFLQEFGNIRYLIIEKGAESALMQQLHALTPIYDGEKYLIFDLFKVIPYTNEMKKEAILVDKIIFNGSILVNEKEYEGINGEISPLKNGYAIVRIDDIKLNVKSFSVIIISGNITFLNVRATRLYFPDALNVAQKIILNGKISFKILNTFDSKRLYIGELFFEGSYNIIPKSWHITSLTAQEHIKAYIKSNNIDFVRNIIMPQGILWAIICTLVFMACFMSEKYKITIKILNV